METLKKARDFDRVFKRGRSVVGQEMVLYVLRGSRPGRRVAFCVSRKLGTAVLRNRMRRRLREVYRLHREKVQARCDLILLARQGAARARFTDLEKTFLDLVERAGILKGAGPGS